MYYRAATACSAPFVRSLSLTSSTIRVRHGEGVNRIYLGTATGAWSGVVARHLVRGGNGPIGDTITYPRLFQTFPARQTKQTAGQEHDEATTKTKQTLRKVLPKGVADTTLRENIYTLPNMLTASRLVAAPFIGYCIIHDYHTTALSLFAYAGITDLLDGWIARRWNLKTVVGTVIDPMADKTLMTVLTVALAMKGALPLWLAVIILGRDISLAVSALYFRWISLPPPKTFARYWDFSLPSAEVRPTMISKYNTALQLGLMGMTTVAPVIPSVDLSTPLGVMQYVVAATTIWSGASYVYNKDAVRILTQPEDQNTDRTNERK